MKKSLIIILFFISQFLVAQSNKQFSLEIEKFEPQLVGYLSSKSNNGEATATKFISDYSHYSAENKKLIVELLNSLRKNRITKLTDYNQVLQSIILLDSIGKDKGANTRSWLISYNKYISGKGASSKQKQKYIESNYNALSRLQLNPNMRSVKWVTKGDLVYDSKDIIQYSINGSELFCNSGSDRLSMSEVKASFLPSTQKIEVEKAKVYWDSESFSTDSVYVLVNSMSIDITEKRIKADSVILTNKYFFKQDILGSIELKTENKNSKKKAYPIFRSYSNNYFFKNITPGIDFSGGVLLKNNTFYGVGDKSRKAVLHCKKYERDAFIFNSNSFIFTRDGINSSEASISIRVMDDSIYHPEVAMSYDVKYALLNVSKNGNKITEAPYSNSHNNIDMYLKSITWKSGSNIVEFNTEKHIDVPFVSNNYYERDIFRQFQGLNNVNPLVQLYDVYMYSEQYDYLTISYVAEEMGMQRQYATHLLMGLASLGYVYVDLDLGIVRFSEKFLNIVEVYKGNRDFDVILFITPEGVSTKGSVDIDNGKISLLDIDRINLSTKKQVYVFPSDTVIVDKALNLTFNGEVNVGNYEFHGSDYSFDYENFKVLMNGNQQMHYYVKSWRIDAQGKLYNVKVINPIDSLRGELFIDFPTNKSGKLDYTDYPKFNNTRDAYVFYDLPEINNGVYTRDKLYVKLSPFELDSLTTVSSRNVKFYGTIHSGGIFPDFDYYVQVQKDYSLGFLYDTEIEGMKIYDKGVYKDELTLDMKGLNGRGRIQYLSSELESDKIELYPDSLKSLAYSFKVDYTVADTLNTPLGLGDNVSVFWKPDADSMTISMKDKPFIFYDGNVILNGDLAFLGNDLTANGDILFETAEMTSDYYNFYGDSINSALLDFKLRETLDSPSEVEINNTKGVVDMLKREGRFMLNQDSAYVSFITSKYIAYIDSIVWKMDDKSIELTSTDEKITPWFVSVDPGQDSLRFQAAEAKYDLVTDKLDISKLLGIEVADAFVYPENDHLEILDNGWMQGFENARIKIGIGSNEHTLEKASLEIHSSKSFTGEAEYYYLDTDSIKHPIVMKSIYVDTLTGKSVGRGDILADEEFMLNPYFSFNGVVEVSGSSPYLRFQGYSGIQNYCDDIDAGEIPIEGNVDPNDVVMDINNFDNLPEFSFIYNGIYSIDSSYSAAFLSTNRDLIDFDFISAQGRITYDEPEACYAIGGDTLNGVKQDEVRFYNDECRLGAKGEMKFYNPDKVISIKSYGNIDYDMNAEIIQTQMVFGLNFEFNKLIMDEIRQALQKAPAKGILEKESKIQKYGFSRLMNKPYGDASENLGGFMSELPEELRFGILFSDIEFFWDADQNLYLSEGDVGVHNFNGHLVNKVFKGKVEIKKRKGGDEITIYIVSQNGKYYYFSYRDSVMNFHTNNRPIMEEFDKIEDVDREKEVNGNKYRFKKASKLKVRSFQNKYI